MGGSDAYSLMVERMKVPLIVLSLSIPLSGLVASNHRSMQLVKTIRGQERKRMYDLYYDHQKEFCTTTGRIIETDEWSYIENADLPLIHRSVYRHNIDELNDEFSPNTTVINALLSFVEEGNNFIESQKVEIFEAIKNDHFKEASDKTLITFENLIMNLNRFREFLMVRPLKSEEKYLTVLKAVCEIDLLRGWFREKYSDKFDKVFNEHSLNELLVEISNYFGFSPYDLDKGRLIAVLQLSEIKKKDSS